MRAGVIYSGFMCFVAIWRLIFADRAKVAQEKSNKPLVSLSLHMESIMRFVSRQRSGKSSSKLANRAFEKIVPQVWSHAAPHNQNKSL
jgi:hypothetical protein